MNIIDKYFGDWRCTVTKLPWESKVHLPVLHVSRTSLWANFMLPIADELLSIKITRRIPKKVTTHANFPVTVRTTV